MTSKKEIITSLRSSTVVFGFALISEGSSRKASIKEFPQFVTLIGTTPLMMTVVCHSDREIADFDEESY